MLKISTCCNFRKLLKFVFIITVLFLFSCSTSQDDPALAEEVEQWHTRRITALTRPYGWLSLTGLHWLKEGENSFGSSSVNDIIFSGTGLPDYMGSFILQDSLVEMRVAYGVTITHGNKPVQNLRLDHDGTGEPTTVNYQSLQWYVIKRGERFAIRVKDSLSENRLNFTGIERFPVQSKWRVTARFTADDSIKTMEVPTELGTIVESPTPGKLTFNISGERFSLHPIADPDDERWFLIFGDETNGEETYGAGRYLYIDAPDSTGTAIIDFNKAYNPPCAFTPYATCSLPPEQNFLDLRITAGEKTYHPGKHK